ncbi:thioredoxin [Mycoplasma wenyonii str. Massachusetts]|uniref:Thioredoxin n=1 Tax=Mycoplasma wenyonii (strain Massachusetts) TaxID=1197325 RepID=I6YAM8_MYCWM|nr:thioredoxin family protein [Mycoplasma wenyonii]AFN65011.1 thioredoxin [Mycoplasma wenyonii str. Massachusetts]
MPEVKSLTSQEELQELLQGSHDLLLDFYADFCPPCRQLMPILFSLSLQEKYQDIKFIKIDVSSFPKLARKYEVSSIPTLILISKDSVKPIEKRVGFMNIDELSSLLDSYFF